jgi:hypothetical protein
VVTTRQPSRKARKKRESLGLRLMLADWSSANMRTDSEPLPGIFYHYTDARGLMGIVKKKVLRATHHRYLNDRGEIRFGFEQALEVLKKLESKIGPKLTKRTKAKIEEMIQGDWYVACVSKSHNKLSQWRAYASDGAGYCIGLSLPDSERSKMGTGQSSTGELVYWSRDFFKCMYGAPKVKKCLREAFLGFITTVRERNLDPEATDMLEPLASELSRMAGIYSQLAKHPHFIEENEWRFVIDTSEAEEEYDVRRNGQLFPFRETDKLQIREVWVGPNAGPDPESAKRTVVGFLNLNEVKATVAVWDSPIVLR